MHYLKHKTSLFTCTSVHKIHYNLTPSKPLCHDIFQYNIIGNVSLCVSRPAVANHRAVALYRAVGPLVPGRTERMNEKTF